MFVQRSIFAVSLVFPLCVCVCVCVVACDGEEEKDELLVDTKVEEDGLEDTTTTTEDQSNSNSEGWFNSTVFQLVFLKLLLYCIVSCGNECH